MQGSAPISRLQLKEQETPSVGNHFYEPHSSLKLKPRISRVKKKILSRHGPFSIEVLQLLPSIVV